MPNPDPYRTRNLPAGIGCGFLLLWGVGALVALAFWVSLIWLIIVAIQKIN